MSEGDWSSAEPDAEGGEHPSAAVGAGDLQAATESTASVASEPTIAVP